MASKQPDVYVTLRLPPGVLAMIDAVAKAQLGIGRSAFFAMAGIMLLAKMSTLLVPQRRAVLLKELEAEFQEIAQEASKAA